MIKCLVNKKVYIGKSKDIYARWKAHIRSAKHAEKYSSLLPKAIHKYGEKNFELVILYECDESNIDLAEVFYIHKTKSIFQDCCYNIAKGGTGGDTSANVEFKKVICLETKEVFKNARQCSLKLKLSATHLSDVLNQRTGRLRVGQLHFMYYTDELDCEKELLQFHNEEERRKKERYKKAIATKRSKTKS